MATLSDYLQDKYTLLSALNNIDTYNKHKLPYEGPKDGQDVGKVSQNYVVKNPIRKIEEPLNNVIMFLNDAMKWTREQIADWIDTLDNQPIFYPKIETVSIPVHGSPIYFRNVSGGARGVYITYACQCRVQGSTVYCGKCERANRRFQSTGHFCYACTHEDESSTAGITPGDPWPF